MIRQSHKCINPIPFLFVRNTLVEYHIKNCKGPCIGQQSHEEYMKNIGEIKDILKGDTQIVSDLLMEEMQALAAEMKFEEAQKIK